MSPSASGAAELLADGGRAAESDDFFRSRPFLEAEGTTHTLRLETDERTTLVPLIVREIPGGGIDATSPYAYPGGSSEGPGPLANPGEIDWAPTGLVSVFLRDRLGEPTLAGGRARSQVLIHDPARPRELRPRLAEQIRAGARGGWSVERCEGPAASPDAVDAFAAAYEQTMRRNEAAERYFFGRPYYGRILGFERSWLLLARGPRDEPGAAAIAARSDDHLHYYLGGTADASLEASPFKNVVAAMLDLADELQVPLNLGGGVSPGDGLERFKRGFANAAADFVTHEIVCDHEAYNGLGGDDAEGFFPAYRAS